MKRLSYFSSLLLALSMPGAAGADETGSATGPATTYQVTVTQIELCAVGSSIDGTGATAPVCINPAVIGSGTNMFDIASVGVNQAVGDYSSFDTLPAGVVYTHARATLTRRFVIAGLLTRFRPGQGPSAVGCRTDSADTSASTTSAGIGIRDSGAGTPQVLYIPDPGSLQGQPLQSDYWSLGLNIVDNTTFTAQYPLTGTINGGGPVPTVTLAFNTQAALSGDWIEGQCWMYPNPPSVDLRVE